MSNRDAMSITITVPADKIENALISAFEGGIGYWAKVDKIEWPAPWPGDVPEDERCSAIAPLYGGSVTLGECDEPSGLKRSRLNGTSVKCGLEIMASLYPRHFADLIGGNSDATTGDVLVQCCVYGKIVYG